ncbi:MAG: lactate racemase domain-containing protein [Dehalococcoidia bacterium]
MKLKVPQLLWYDNTELELEFPDSWDVHFLPPKGHNRPRISPQEMERAFTNPIGTPRLRELAQGKKEVVIIFDDIARPTPVGEIAPFVLAELKEAGISDDHIRFVAALGSHGAHDNHAFRKKLGQEILERYPVYNHNPYENCTPVGKTSRGTPLAVNREVMSCDLKIGIGCILPHPQVGFGGGSKIILPGVAHIDSIDHFHREVMGSAPQTTGMGNWDENVMRFDAEEAAQMAGLDVTIDALFNLRGEMTDLSVGAPLAEHHEGVKLAKEIYATEGVSGADIAVSNAYLKANEAGIAMLAAVRSIKLPGGTVVLIMNAPEGQVTHYLLRSFGTTYGGRQYVQRTIPPTAFKVIVLNPQKDLTCVDWFADAQSVIWAKDWSEAMDELRASHPNGAKVAVYPDATMQYLASMRPA